MTLRLLSQYLFQFHRLPLPELGTLVLTRHTAQLNMIDQMIEPGAYKVELRMNESDSRHLTEWLATHLNRSADEVVLILKDYVIKIKEHLNNAENLIWGNLGVMEKAESGHFIFQGNVLKPIGYESFHAGKVIRTNSELKVLAGDHTYVGRDLVELLRNTKRKKVSKKGQLTAISFILCFIIIIYALLVNKDIREKHQQHFNLNSKEAPKTYTILSSDE